MNVHSEDKVSAQAANMEMPEGGRAGKLQVVRVENKSYEAYKMSTGQFWRNGRMNSYLCSWHDPLVLNMQTNPRLSQMKQLRAPFQNGASKIL